jgi:hypothetical protein
MTYLGLFRERLRCRIVDGCLADTDGRRRGLVVGAG